MDRKLLQFLLLCEDFFDCTDRNAKQSREVGSEAAGELEEMVEAVLAALGKLARAKRRDPLSEVVAAHRLDRVEKVLLCFHLGMMSRELITSVPYCLRLCLARWDRLEEMKIRQEYLWKGARLFREGLLTRLRGQHFSLDMDLFLRICAWARSPGPVAAAPPPPPPPPPEAREIHGFLARRLVGQEAALRRVSLAVARHFRSGGKARGRNFLLVGPTGCGKTEIARALAAYLEVPLVFADASEMTATGYYGRSVSSVIQDLLFAARGDREKAERGIVFIDEIDKIAEKRGSQDERDVSGRSVQEELLGILETIREKDFGQGMRNYQPLVLNPSGVLFIAAGAFSGLEKGRRAGASPGGPVGFAASPDTGEPSGDPLSARDLERYGMIPELLGRFGEIIELSRLGPEELEKVLEMEPGGSLAGYRADFERFGSGLSLTAGARREIARAADRQGLGARGLDQVMARVVRPVLWELETGEWSPGGEIVIDREAVLEALAGRPGRAGRGERAVAGRLARVI